MAGRKRTRPDDRAKELAYDDQHLMFAWIAHRVLAIEWLDDTYTVEARRHLPGLLVGLYLTDREGATLTMRQACDLMGVDFANTGPRYVRLAADRGLLQIRERPPEDRRKTLISPTQKLKDLVAGALDRIRDGYQLAYSPDAVRIEFGVEYPLPEVISQISNPAVVPINPSTYKPLQERKTGLTSDESTRKAPKSKRKRVHNPEDA